MKYLLTAVLFLGMLFTCGNANAQYVRPIVVYPRVVPYYYYGYNYPLYYNRGIGLNIQGNGLNFQFNRGVYPYNYQFRYNYNRGYGRMPGSHYFPPTPHPSNNWSKRR